MDIISHDKMEVYILQETLDRNFLLVVVCAVSLSWVQFVRPIRKQLKCTCVIQRFVQGQIHLIVIRFVVLS